MVCAPAALSFACCLLSDQWSLALFGSLIQLANLNSASWSGGLFLILLVVDVASSLALVVVTEEIHLSSAVLSSPARHNNG